MAQLGNWQDLSCCFFMCQQYDVYQIKLNSSNNNNNCKHNPKVEKSQICIESDTWVSSCRFCNKRFFGENELFFHMQHAHEQCHICKKQHPDRFVYYRDYNELEGELYSLSALEGIYFLTLESRTKDAVIIGFHTTSIKCILCLTKFRFLAWKGK